MSPADEFRIRILLTNGKPLQWRYTGQTKWFAAPTTIVDYQIAFAHSAIPIEIRVRPDA